MPDQIQICPRCEVVIYRGNAFFSHCKKSSVEEVTPDNIYSSYKQAHTLTDLNDRVCAYIDKATDPEVIARKCINKCQGQATTLDPFKLNVK